MTSHDKVVERLARALCNADDGGHVDSIFAAEHHDGDCTGQPFTCSLCQKEHYTGLAGEVLPSLRCGDNLGNGLWAAPEEPTYKMELAGKKAMPVEVVYTPLGGGRIQAEPRPPNECVSPGSVFKAMRRAAGGNDG